MAYKWRNIPALLRTPLGRIQFIHALRYRSWPVLSCAANLHRRLFARKTRLVVVVGSFGKTTTTRSILTVLGKHVPDISTGNIWDSVALNMLRIRPTDKHAVIEVGIDGVGQMALYANMIRPDITVVTSIGSEHHRSLKTLEVTRDEKSEMVRRLPETGIAILNGDDPNVLWMKGQTPARVITFGFNEENDIRASEVSLDWPNGTRFKLHVGDKTHNIHIRLIGKHMIYPALAAVAVSLVEGFNLNQILSSLKLLFPTPGRMEPVKLENGAIILRDDFKSSFETIEASLDVFSQVTAQRRIVVLGEVDEPPGSQGPIYGQIGKRMAKTITHAIIIAKKRGFQGYKVGATKTGFPKSELIHVGKGVHKAIELLRKETRQGDVVLIKGSSNQRLERISLALTGEKVSCDISFCKAVLNCDRCPILENGWKNLRVVI